MEIVIVLVVLGVFVATAIWDMVVAELAYRDYKNRKPK